VCCFTSRLNNPLTFSRLVSLQSAILDNETSLDQVVQKIDGILKEDEGFPLVCSQPCCEFTLTILQRREVFEREARIRELRANHGTVIDRIATSMKV